MLIKHIIMEASISHSKACKLASVPIRVLAASNCSFNQSVLKQLLVEEASMSAKVSYQVADLGTDTSIFMGDEVIQISINICVVNRIVEVLGDSSELGDQTQGIYYQLRRVVQRQKLVLVHCGKTTSMDELLCEVL